MDTPSPSTWLSPLSSESPDCLDDLHSWLPDLDPPLRKRKRQDSDSDLFAGGLLESDFVSPVYGDPDLLSQQDGNLQAIEQRTEYDTRGNSKPNLFDSLTCSYEDDYNSNLVEENDQRVLLPSSKSLQVDYSFENHHNSFLSSRSIDTAIATVTASATTDDAENIKQPSNTEPLTMPSTDIEHNLIQNDIGDNQLQNMPLLESPSNLSDFSPSFDQENENPIDLDLFLSQKNEPNHLSCGFVQTSNTNGLQLGGIDTEINTATVYVPIPTNDAENIKQQSNTGPVVMVNADIGQNTFPNMLFYTTPALVNLANLNSNIGHEDIRPLESKVQSGEMPLSNGVDNGSGSGSAISDGSDVKLEEEEEEYSKIKNEMKLEVEETKADMHICLQCNREFKTRNELRTHSRSEHPKRKQVSCEKCGARFSARCNMLKHVRSVHDRVKEHKCDDCSKYFSEKNKLVKHINTVHKKERSFVCQIESCKSKFSQNSDLTRHINTVHNKQCAYSCQACFRNNAKKFKFTRRSSLVQHLIRIHQHNKQSATELCNNAITFYKIEGPERKRVRYTQVEIPNQ